MTHPQDRWAEGVVVERPGQGSPTVVWLVRHALWPLVRLCHRPTLGGSERLPRDRPYLLVANHSGGLGIAELLSFVALYVREVGPGRPLAGFAHPASFHVFPISAAHRAIGSVPSTYAFAAQTLARGVPLIIFPGGDHETMRPLWQAHRVDFAGRLGFLRIARTAGVPIVPLGIRGGHFTAPILFRSKLLATLCVLPRLLGVKRWGLSLLGLVVAVAMARWLPLAWPWRALAIWAWLASGLSFLAWIPWTLRFTIGEPLEAATLFEREMGEGDEETLRRALAVVEARVQRLVDAGDGAG